MLTNLFIVAIISIFGLVQCGDFFTVNGQSYYSSFPQKGTAFDSYQFCVYNGMYLIEVMDQPENERVLSVINAVNKKYNVTALSYWTSGTDLSTKNGWWWANNGYSAMYTNWADNQPDNLYVPSPETTDNCLVYGNAPNYQWNAASCVSEHHFLCRDSFNVPSLPTKSC